MEFRLTEEQQMWQAAVHEFAAAELRPRAAELDARSEFNSAAMPKMAALGLLGLNIPEEHGGAGVDPIGSAIALEELGWACGGTALSVAAHNGLACAPIALFGTPEQRRRWLPGLARGEGGLGALALTEPGGGSDLLGSVATRAELRAGEWEIHGNKAWITNASIASLIVVLCRTDPEAGSGSLSLIVVPTGAAGVHIHPPEDKLGVRASPTHALTLEAVRVPADHLLGTAGEGIYQSLQVLDGGRIGIGALSVGLAQAAFEEAVRYAQQREAFGSPLSQHQAIQAMLADGWTEIEAARLLVYRAAWLKGRGEPFSREAAIAKLFASEMAERVARNAIQILGAYGYSREFPVERIYRDARLMTIGEGTSEIQRLVIARRTLGIE